MLLRDLVVVALDDLVVGLLQVVVGAVLLGVLVAAWWILFAPDSMMEYSLKVILGVVAGLLATGSYLFNLRKTLFPQDLPPPVSEDQ